MRKNFLLCTLVAVFASMQISYADGLANASINSTMGGFVGMETGTNSATLNFNRSAAVNWNTLNVGQNETLNFNAVDGATGLTVLNRVTGGQMSHIYGTINSNEGISNLIISNPSGLLFDGASFNAAGDVTLTTQSLCPLGRVDSMGNTYFGGFVGSSNAATSRVKIENSDFNVGGNFRIVAPGISIGDTNITTPQLKMVTRDGQDFLVNDYNSLNAGVKMSAVNVNGNVYIVSGLNDIDILDSNVNSNYNEGIIGELKIESQGNVNLNYDANENSQLNVGSLHVDTTGEAPNSYVKAQNVNLPDNEFYIRNQNGDVIIRHICRDFYASNPNYTSQALILASDDAVLLGNNMFFDGIYISAGNDIIVGNQNIIPGELPGSLSSYPGDGGIGYVRFNAGGNVLIKDPIEVPFYGGQVFINAGKNILTTSDNDCKIWTDRSTLTANGYIGSIIDSDVLDDIMYNNAPINDSVKDYMNIESEYVTLNASEARIKGEFNMNISGNADKMYLTVDGAGGYIPNGGSLHISPNTNAGEIIVGNETGSLYVPLESRNYDLKFTDIHDSEVTELSHGQAITYEDFNAPGGHNDGVQTPFNTWVDAPTEPSRAQVRMIDKNVISNVKTMPLMTSKKKK